MVELTVGDINRRYCSQICRSMLSYTWKSTPLWNLLKDRGIFQLKPRCDAGAEPNHTTSIPNIATKTMELKLLSLKDMKLLDNVLEAEINTSCCCHQNELTSSTRLSISEKTSDTHIGASKLVVTRGAEAAIKRYQKLRRCKQVD
ncbi:unnamed protein product [Vicia faba]|uniref:Uncharacterized protein n=1 Tax=Vicia faba TaxID=3906 RepID=A0AAV1A6B0_VICFA|nr:unnamed protein product [Vicia faba]